MNGVNPVNMIDNLLKILSCFACRSDCKSDCDSKCFVGPKRLLFKIFSNRKLNESVEIM